MLDIHFSDFCLSNNEDEVAEMDSSGQEAIKEHLKMVPGRLVRRH